MSKCLTIGTCTYSYPEQGTNPGWGEEATCWAVAVTGKLNTLSGPNDKNVTCVSITNNINICNGFPCGLPIGAGITSLSFSTSACTGVRSFIVDYNVVRTGTVSNGCTPTYETGSMTGIYNGTDWNFNHEFVGCAGVDFTISASGQINYYTDSTKGPGNIKFRAKTLDQ